MFKFSIHCYLSGKRYSLNVEQIYNSKQVLRFKVTFLHKNSEREITLQKLLIRKKNQWQIYRGYAKEADVLSMARAIDWQLDELAGKHKKYPHPKNNWPTDPPDNDFLQQT